MAPYREDKSNVEVMLEGIDKKIDSIKEFTDTQNKEKFGIFRFLRALLASMTLGLEAAQTKARSYEFKGEFFMVMHWLFLIAAAIGVFWILSRTACTEIDANREIINQHQEEADRHYCEPGCAVIGAQYVTRNHSCVTTRNSDGTSTCDSSYTEVCSCTRGGHFFMVNPQSGMIRERGPYVAPDMPEQESH